jgi:hypothetical protein
MMNYENKKRSRTMYKLLLLLIILSGAYFISSCKKDDTPQEIPPVNNPPASPSSPLPKDSAVNVSTSPVLGWLCSDPDSTDILNYNIYFGTSNPPATLLVSNWSRRDFAVSGLAKETTYYWKVTAHDLRGDSSSGPVWRFKTIPSLSTVIRKDKFKNSMK